MEAVEDTLIIQFEYTDRTGLSIPHNDSLVITTTLANYEVIRIFIDSSSSTDILFGEVNDQTQLGDSPWKG
ncbi:UNVERIFIED_CONTAM: hypothetical protein Slati_3162600 [Sesamum latifolium]|uniref:Uncharacterized protein n=1 Tax=Sesamum latifolium TaxID=2727402 RepID=A0AAW2UY82_9LAMI